jgi:hypothetical protein
MLLSNNVIFEKQLARITSDCILPVRKVILDIIITIAILFVVARGTTAQEKTQYELWPEIDGFIQLNNQFRVYLVTAYAKGRESDVEVLDLAANIDISLKPLLRKKFMQKDWQRSRFLWVRLGYDYISKLSSGEKSTPENRGMVNLYVKYQLPVDIWLEARTRADLRWIGEDYSTRYRLRLEATREFTGFNYSVVPYLNCEVFYDTRYSGWSRLFIMAGSEFTINKHFRFELYLAPQIDYLPSRANLLAFGIVAKFYF